MSRNTVAGNLLLAWLNKWPAGEVTIVVVQRRLLRQKEKSNMYDVLYIPSQCLKPLCLLDS